MTELQQTPLNDTTLLEGIDTVAQAEEFYASWAILIIIALLCGTLLVSYFLQRRKITFIHESTVAIFMGMFVGVIIKLMNDPILKSNLSFKYTIFFNILLPPIILSSGYELDRKTFFKNFGLILTFAFVGTTISSMIIGGLIYLFTSIGINRINMSFVECLMLGSILSSTDPVTVLAIFSQLKVDPKLYAIIFGESMLNDSVAIVLFESLQHVANKELEGSLIWEGFGYFIISFLGSLMIGSISGFTISLMLKLTKLHTIPLIESSLVTLLAYGTYFFSNFLSMSGIVSLLFCSIILKHYGYSNMSKESQNTTTSLFKLLAQLSENFCFIYLGIALFTSPVENYSFLLVLCSLFSVCFARYCSTIPLSKVINKIQKMGGNTEEVISHEYQLMLFWAGLRGAVAFALAMEMESTNSSVMRSTILIVVVVTVIFFGGTTPVFIKHLGIQTGVDSTAPIVSTIRNSFDLYSDEHEEDEDSYGGSDNALLNNNPEIVVHHPGSNLNAKSPESNSSTILTARDSFELGTENWFNSIDDHILKPIFTHKKAPHYNVQDHLVESRASSSNGFRNGLNEGNSMNYVSESTLGQSSDFNDRSKNSPSFDSPSPKNDHLS
ncbi:sodium/hydrogen exchanger [Neoconidiobolus thromboides FSU 785]|nr:sodium/hydrogen exchanger [Neoconidiobolus thromboides FSU 785]